MNALLKVVLIGDSGSGKTSLLTMFINKQFREKYKTTIGADFLTREVMIGDKLVTLQLWDTAGQERFNSLGAAFFRGADICILVFDLTRAESLEHLPRWKSEFLEQASIVDQNYPFVCLGNKYDLPGQRALNSDKCREFCENLGCVTYLETSAKTGENVERAFITAASFVLNKSTPGVRKTNPSASGTAAPTVDLTNVNPTPSPPRAAVEFECVKAPKTSTASACSERKRRCLAAAG